MNGALDLSGSTVTAVLAVWGGCINDQLARFTGTRSGQTLSLTGASGGTTIRVTGTPSADLSSFTGTYRSEGGACGAGPDLAMTGQRADLDGVWSDENVTLTIGLATVPSDAKGSFALSGTAQFNDNPCVPSATLQNAARGRLVFADITSGPNTYMMDGEVSPDLKQMRYTYRLSAGSCADRPSGSGTMTRR